MRSIFDASLVLVMGTLVVLGLIININSCAQALDVDGELLEECGIENSPYQLEEVFFDASDIITLAIRIIKMQPSNSALAIDTQSLYSAIDTLNNKLLEANIQFELIGIHEVESDDSYMNMEDYKSHFRAFERANFKTLSPSLNIFVYPPTPTFYPGVTPGIAAGSFAIQNQWLLGSTLIHEMGHALGLFHTHQYDNTNGSSYETGDLCCDTPFFELSSSDVDPYCIYMKTQSLHPDDMQTLIQNWMSYTRKTCRQEFTQDQIDRMRKVIEETPVLRTSIISIK